MAECEHDYSGFERDSILRRVCLRCLCVEPAQPAPTVTLTRERLEAMLRDCWAAADADWTSYTTKADTERKRAAFIARALAEIDGGGA